jgi:hypothetical protein
LWGKGTTYLVLVGNLKGRDIEIDVGGNLDIEDIGWNVVNWIYLA